MFAGIEQGGVWCYTLQWNLQRMSLCRTRCLFFCAKPVGDLLHGKERVLISREVMAVWLTTACPRHTCKAISSVTGLISCDLIWKGPSFFRPLFQLVNNNVASMSTCTKRLGLLFAICLGLASNVPAVKLTPVTTRAGHCVAETPIYLHIWKATNYFVCLTCTRIIGPPRRPAHITQ